MKSYARKTEIHSTDGHKKQAFNFSDFFAFIMLHIPLFYDKIKTIIF